MFAFIFDKYVNEMNGEKKWSERTNNFYASAYI